jgi:hypothetical protein
VRSGGRLVGVLAGRLPVLGNVLSSLVGLGLPSVDLFSMSSVNASSSLYSVFSASSSSSEVELMQGMSVPASNRPVTVSIVSAFEAAVLRIGVTLTAAFAVFLLWGSETVSLGVCALVFAFYICG